MNTKGTRLDHALAALQAAGQADGDVERWEVLKREFEGIVLTGASDDVRQAIESCGVACNAITRTYQGKASECPGEWDPADLAKLVGLLRGLAELIRDAESERILARLRNHGGVLPEAEIIEARRHQDWFASLLLSECRAAIDAYVEHAVGGDVGREDEGEEDKGEDAKTNSIPFLSLYLFSEWNVVESVADILRGLKLPGDAAFDLFGDAVHEQVPRYLAQFLSDDLDRIDELVRNPNGNLYVRWASVGSYPYLVRDRAVSLEDAVHRLDRLFDETKVADEDGRPGMGHPYELSGGIVEAITSIGGVPRCKSSNRSLDWQFVDDSIIGGEGFAERSEQADSSELSRKLLMLPPTRLIDCVDELRNWAAFMRTPSRPQHSPVPRPKDRVRPKAGQAAPRPPANATPKSARVPRNAKCPCGSGKKYKQCCLRHAGEAEVGDL